MGKAKIAALPHGYTRYVSKARVVKKFQQPSELGEGLGYSYGSYGWDKRVYPWLH